MIPDFDLTFRGSLFVLTPRTVAGHAWVTEHLADDLITQCGGTVIEAWRIEDIVLAIDDAELTVQ
jgi:hypothetical protein